MQPGLCQVSNVFWTSNRSFQQRQGGFNGCMLELFWNPVDTMWRDPPRPRVHIPPNGKKGKIIDSKVALGGICDRSQEGIALYFRPANLELTTFSWLFLNRPKEQRNASFCWYVDRTHWYVRSVGTEKHHWFEGLLPQEITSKNDAREMSPPLKYGMK